MFIVILIPVFQMRKLRFREWKGLLEFTNRCRAEPHIHTGFYFKLYFACKALMIGTKL